jgi:hypothetical protein
MKSCLSIIFCNKCSPSNRSHKTTSATSHCRSCIDPGARLDVHEHSHNQLPLAMVFDPHPGTAQALDGALSMGPKHLHVVGTYHTGEKLVRERGAGSRERGAGISSPFFLEF